MNLRRQLLLVSLLTLILPWAGVQFIRETESALREGQQQMLGGTAQAIADSLSQFPYELISEDQGSPGNRIYAHPLQNAPLVDGYANDWTVPDGSMVNLRGKDGMIRYVAGIHRQHWFLFVEVPDKSVVYRNAARNSRRYDYVALTSIGAGGERVSYRFGAEAPGDLVPISVSAGGSFDETRIAGFWRDTAIGYQLEIRLPRNLAGPRLGISVINMDNETESGVESRTWEGRNPGSIVAMSPVLQSVVSGYVQPGLRLIVTDKDGWRLAQAGNISASGGSGQESATPSGWLRIVYNLVLEPGAEAALAEPSPTGREQQSYVSEALDGRATTRWFRSPETGRAVVSVAQPVWSGTVQTGAVILQQGTDAILSLTNQALARLIILTLVATLVVAAVLIGYASWLSLRIRNLSSAAERALDDKRLKSALPSALAGDEVGDLSRSFSSVLRQLGNYNDYLQSLASKLSHELRTPLTIVRSSLENLEHENLSAEAVEYTERAKEGAERLQQILNAMSEANRTEALIENIEPEPFDLAQLLQSTVAAYADAWPERKFDFDNRASQSVIVGSPELITQMLDKLVDNAVDFSAEGDRILVTLESDANNLLLAVDNPGPPLPEDMQAELFRSMVSVRRGDPGKHLGLGLYIVRLIAEGHNGSVEATNTDGGVSFRVQLPANISV